MCAAPVRPPNVVYMDGANVGHDAPLGGVPQQQAQGGNVWNRMAEILMEKWAGFYQLNLVLINAERQYKRRNVEDPEECDRLREAVQVAKARFNQLVGK